MCAGVCDWITIRVRTPESSARYSVRSGRRRQDPAAPGGAEARREEQTRGGWGLRGAVEQAPHCAAGEQRRGWAPAGRAMMARRSLGPLLGQGSRPGGRARPAPGCGGAGAEGSGEKLRGGWGADCVLRGAEGKRRWERGGWDRRHCGPVDFRLCRSTCCPPGSGGGLCPPVRRVSSPVGPGFFSPCS